uniref:FZ domain-containing protein n=1 Tax=Takifugu rubripes TaxID=31033 RepID=A0A674N1X8_TAKRU
VSDACSLSSSRCFAIPPNMALCQNIGYDTMRMPNLLGHESPAEAVQQSASWLPLLARECHPDARIFLCSLFAPICYHHPAGVCGESVRESCAPIMSCYDHLMCISSITNSTAQLGGQRAPQASCQDCYLCLSPFLPVVKLRLTRLKYSPLTLSQYSLGSKLVILKHGAPFRGADRSRIELWLERDASCVRNIPTTPTIQEPDRRGRKWKQYRCRN